MNKLQRLLFGEVRDYAKAQSFDIVIAEGVHLRHADGRHHRRACWQSLQARAEAGRRAAPARRASRPRSPERAAPIGRKRAGRHDSDARRTGGAIRL